MARAISSATPFAAYASTPRAARGGRDCSRGDRRRRVRRHRSLEPAHRCRGVDDELARRVDNRRLLLRRQPLLDAIALGVVQRRQDERVVHRVRALGLDVPFDQVGRFALVAREQALVVAYSGASAGVSAINVQNNPSPGTCLPSTTRQTVSGVAISSPSGPQSQVQNATDISSATCETPAAPA